MKRIPVFIVDGQTLFRDILARFIADSDKFEVAEVFGNAEDLFTFLEAAHYGSRSVCLLEIDLPGMNGFVAHQFLLDQYPFIKTFFLSEHSNRSLIRTAMFKRAGSYLVKQCNAEELAEAIEQVYHFDQFFSSAVLEAMKWDVNDQRTEAPQIEKAQGLLNRLSKRELEILILICAQMTSQDIADKLFISLRTVENHRNNLLLKTHSHNIAGLIFFAIRNDLYYPGQ